MYLGHNAAIMVTYTIVFNMVFSALTLAEMTILKCLYISKWSKMAMIEDDFVARILTEGNILISMTTTFVRIYLGEPMNNYHYINSRGFKVEDLTENWGGSWYKTINIW